ncbi:hypothetical protein NP493_308g01004 [Ridgeia piscesae]|uniref:Uncharacterized protein n=1 Tax=Ridgeia piscesae TaxID=27915 RepID=A0AAD9NW43_RIDPI|nr:hypothetical protein NP493_308g01004 [Ridgeia piscesae]
MTVSGVYAVLLTAEDRAGNIQTARRFLIFDNVYVVTINTASDKQLFVDSAAVNTTYTWVTSLQAPDFTGVNPIPNVNAIVKYDIYHDVDHQGGRTLTAPGTWRAVPDFRNETIKLQVPRIDADSIRVWIRGWDVMGNWKVDSVLVHVDSTPPIIEDVYFSRHGRTHLAVLHSTALHGIT